MQNLVIQLGGEIQRSNFDEWRSTFMGRLRAIKTDLRTDEDFGDAAQLVKELKNGEDALKKAKASAMDQSADIQRLFAAIDEVSEAARQTRLTLQRQIKQRKQELKDLAIDEGVAQIRQVLAAQSPEFLRLDTRDYVDRDHFVQAVKGKASLKGVQTAILAHCRRVSESIEQKAASVSDNVALLAGLPTEHQVLFQDRGRLLDMEHSELAAVIDRRLVAYRAEQERKALSLKPDPNAKSIPVEPTRPAQPQAPQPSKSQPEAKGEYLLAIQLHCTKSEAQDIARSIREHLEGTDAVKEMRLTVASKP